MIRRFAIATASLIAAVMLARGIASAEEKRGLRSAFVHRGILVCLDDGGDVCAWNLESGKSLADISAKLSRKGLIRLATDGTKIWAADESTLYTWSQEESSWRKVSEFTGDRESLEDLVAVGGVPMLVFPSKVKDVIGARTFKVPELTSTQVNTHKLRIRAVLGTESMLWVGTGYGEWGGHLVGLTMKTGDWVQFYDALHYVTGIASDNGGVVVSWSMSHFGANTLIRLHKADASVRTEYPSLESKYYQRIVYSSFDQTLYGIETSNVVSIREGRPTKVAELHGHLFEREPRAIGVAPGVLAMIPVAPSTLVVIPKSGEPWVIRKGKVTGLKRP
jgi:hypothetical protein